MRFVSSNFYLIVLWVYLSVICMSFNFFTEEFIFSSVLFKIFVVCVLTHGIVGCIHVVNDYTFDKILQKIYVFLLWCLYLKLILLCIFVL